MMMIQRRLYKTLAQLQQAPLASGATTPITVHGWVQGTRAHKKIAFISINDGSSSEHTQIVLEPPPSSSQSLPPTGTSVRVTGHVMPTQRGPVPYEIHSTNVTVVGESSLSSYVFPKPSTTYSLAYTRTHPHLRARTTAFAAMMRIRSAATLAIHTFLQREAHCHHIHAPTLTPLDCEGAGELFAIHEPDPKAPFFGTPMYLSVSGQLYAEMAACGGLSRVYTFGPTYRAEHSHTTRHLAEFWMVEPEIAHASLADVIDLTDGLLRHTVKYLLDNHASDMREVHGKAEHNVRTELEQMLSRPSTPCITYTEAVKQLGLQWGAPISTEHEKKLAVDMEGPVFVTHYPRTLKPFYMRQQTAAAAKVVECMDFLVPRVGELAGGSERESDVDVLQQSMAGMENIDAYQWYLDLRRYGSVPHAGFGVGLERLLLYVSGWSNIRDVTLVSRVAGGISGRV